jgi:regulator of replication initiation timing
MAVTSAEMIELRQLKRENEVLRRRLGNAVPKLEKVKSENKRLLETLSRARLYAGQ